MERQYTEAKETNSKLEKLVAANKLTDTYNIEILNFKNRHTSKNFMSLLVKTLQLKSDPNGDSAEITLLKTQLPDAIKNMATSNFCILWDGNYFFCL
jgi:hypothetical protein